MRTLRRWLPVAALLASSSGCLSLENRLLFHPAASVLSEEELAAHPQIRDVSLRSADGNQIHARWFPHPQSTGVVLFCPGNAGNLDYRTYPVRKLAAELKVSVLIFDYPGFGKSEGQPSEAGCYAAATAAYDWLTKSERLPPENLILYGESLGGGVAVDLAQRKPHRALVLVRTFTSVPDVAQSKVLLPIRWLVQNQFDSLKKIKNCPQPVFIAYADKDHIMSSTLAPQLQAAATSRCELFLLKGLGHNDPLGRDFYDALRSFLELVL